MSLNRITRESNCEISLEPMEIKMERQPSDEETGYHMTEKKEY